MADFSSSAPPPHFKGTEICQLALDIGKNAASFAISLERTWKIGNVLSHSLFSCKTVHRGFYFTYFSDYLAAFFV